MTNLGMTSNHFPELLQLGYYKGVIYNFADYDYLVSSSVELELKSPVLLRVVRSNGADHFWTIGNLVLAICRANAADMKILQN
jgi:hypothetical protein